MKDLPCNLGFVLDSSLVKYRVKATLAPGFSRLILSLARCSLYSLPQELCVISQCLDPYVDCLPYRLRSMGSRSG